MGVLENKRIVQSFFEAGNRGDMDTCFGLIADDVVWTNMGSTGFSGVFRGKDELMAKLLGPLFGRLKTGISSTVDRLIAEGDVVVALTSGTAKTVDGRAYDNNYCQVIRIADGKFAEVIEYCDTDLLRRTFS